MWAVKAYASNSPVFKRSVAEICLLKPDDFLASALAAGECDSIRAALRKNKILDRVKDVLRCLEFALRGVEGSESERAVFRLKFEALRTWNGCSFVFFTLNPHDLQSPLLVKFVTEHRTQTEMISLDWDDEATAQFYERAKKGSASRLHELAAQWPAAGALCVHWAFDQTIQKLCRCAPAANWKPEEQHVHTIPALCGMPGMFGYGAGYLGMVEPQMRKTEHLHSIWQVMGYDNPRAFFDVTKLAERFRELFVYAASISFESVEAFAAQRATGSGMEALRSAAIMPVRKGQQAKLGSERAAECLQAQYESRGMAGAADVDAVYMWCFKIVHLFTLTDDNHIAWAARKVVRRSRE